MVCLFGFQGNAKIEADLFWIIVFMQRMAQKLDAHFSHGYEGEEKEKKNVLKNKKRQKKKKKKKGRRKWDKKKKKNENKRKRTKRRAGGGEVEVFFSESLCLYVYVSLLLPFTTSFCPLFLSVRLFFVCLSVCMHVCLSLTICLLFFPSFYSIVANKKKRHNKKNIKICQETT